MPVSKIRRGAASAKVGFPNANDIRVDPTTDTLRFGTGVSGTTEKQVADLTSTQTMSGKTFTGAQQFNAAAGAAGAVTEVAQNKTVLDNTATDMFTVTVPNAICGAGIQVFATSTLGDGDSSDSALYNIGVSRITGAAAKAVAGAKLGTGATAGATANAVLTVAVSAIAGAVGAVNTFTITIKNARSAGAADNHPTSAIAILVNNKASGITIAAA